MSAEHAPSTRRIQTVHTTDRDFKNAEFRLQTLDSLTEFVDPNNYLEAFTNLYEDGAYPLIYSNHSQHANIAGFRRIWRGMRARPEHFNVIVAHSLTTGKQKGDLGSSSSAMKQMFEEENVHFLEVMRKKDEKDYRDRGIDESIILEAKRESERNMKKVYFSLRKNNNGLFVFPAGTTVEADKKWLVKRRGMQRVETPILPDIVELGFRFNREIAFLPVGHRTTYRIVEPRSTRGRPLAYVAVGMERAGWGAPKLAQTVIGEPFTLSQMASDNVDFQNNDQVNDYAMRRVAKLLPPKARGYYR